MPVPKPAKTSPSAKSKPTGDPKTVGEVLDEMLAKAAGKAKKKKKIRKPKPAKAFRPAVITFIDILGFSDLVAKSDNPQTIRDILRRLASFAANAEESEHEVDETAAVVFSDSIIRVRFIDGRYRSGALFQEVLKLLHVQGEMLSDNVLLRGGLTVGMIHVEGQLAFGPGFIRAYQLESEFANYPRIVIGPEVFKALRASDRLVAEHHDLADEIHYQGRMLKRGDDGLWFIDYLYGIWGEMDEPENHPALVEQHRALIISRANAAPENSRVLQKYLWLAGYLNDVAERISRPDLKITRTEISALEALEDEPEWAKTYEGPIIGAVDVQGGD